MGLLRHVDTGAEYLLPAQYLIGRARQAALQISNGLVSGAHAELRWNGSAWELRDLDSRNGTFVDGDRLERGERRLLKAGSLLAFGDPQDCYEVIRASPPHVNATSSTGELREAADGPLLLPDADAPVWFVYTERGSWHAESSDGNSHRVATGATLEVGDATWTLELPVMMEQTLSLDGYLALDRVTLRFSVSQDEEHVELDVVAGRRTLRLPTRTFWYTLLTLARAYVRDRERGASESAAGWIHIEDLMQMLRLEQNTLHQHFCRARRELSHAGVAGYARLVERRPAARQVRLGTPQVEITTL